MHSTFLRPALLIPLFGLAIFLSACEISEPNKDALTDAFEAPTDPTLPELPDLGLSCKNERFTQPEAEVERVLDLLFIVDASDSLFDEKSAIADGILEFVAALPAGTDYRIAVMLAHGPESKWNGKLFQAAKQNSYQEPVVLKSSTQSLAQIQSDLRRKLMNTEGEWKTDGGELGLRSVLDALKSDKLAASRSKGFFRENAALAVTFIADENDICAEYPSGVTPVVDAQNNEPQSKIKYCAGVTPEAVVQRLKALQGSRPLLVSGVLYNNKATVPQSDENEYGYGYMETIGLARGISVDAASGDIAGDMNAIGKMATVRMNLLKNFVLAGQNIDKSSLNVKVDGGVVPFTFSEVLNEVRLSEAGTARSTVDVAYCLNAPEVDGEPDPGEETNDDEPEDDTYDFENVCTALSCPDIGI